GKGLPSDFAGCGPDCKVVAPDGRTITAKLGGKDGPTLGAEELQQASKEQRGQVKIYPGDGRELSLEQYRGELQDKLRLADANTAWRNQAHAALDKGIANGKFPAGTQVVCETDPDYCYAQEPGPKGAQ